MQNYQALQECKKWNIGEDKGDDIMYILAFSPDFHNIRSYQPLANLFIFWKLSVHSDCFSSDYKFVKTDFLFANSRFFLIAGESDTNIFLRYQFGVLCDSFWAS